MSTAPGVQLLGVNLSGAEYGNPVTGRMNYDYVYPTTSEIDYFASLGLNTIRIPIAWQRLQPVQDGPLSTTQLAQLDALVAYAATKGVTVDIDLHNYGAGYGAAVGTASTPDSAFANFWSQMARHYAAAGNIIFGLMNEPNAQTPAAWAAATQWAAANGKKLFLGEFGAGSDPASLTALGNTLNYLNANATVWQGGTYWAGGPWMGDYMFSADPQNGVEAPPPRAARRSGSMRRRPRSRPRRPPPRCPSVESSSPAPRPRR